MTNIIYGFRHSGTLSQFSCRSVLGKGYDEGHLDQLTTCFDLAGGLVSGFWMAENVTYHFQPYDKKWAKIQIPRVYLKKCHFERRTLSVTNVRRHSLFFNTVQRMCFLYFESPKVLLEDASII